MIEAHSTAELQSVPRETVHKLYRGLDAEEAIWAVVEQDALFDVEPEAFYGTSGSGFVCVAEIRDAFRSAVRRSATDEEELATWPKPFTIGTGTIVVAADLMESVTSHLEAIGGFLPPWTLSPIGYSLRRPLWVSRFLSRNPALMSLLMQARPRISQYFPGAELVLEFMADPEVPDCEQLLILIQTDLSVDEALDRLDLLDADWWLGVSREAHGKLCIDVEFL